MDDFEKFEEFLFVLKVVFELQNYLGMNNKIFVEYLIYLCVESLFFDDFCEKIKKIGSILLLSLIESFDCLVCNLYLKLRLKSVVELEFFYRIFEEKEQMFSGFMFLDKEVFGDGVDVIDDILVFFEGFESKVGGGL